MPASQKIFRIFVSSTFSDLKVERNALQEMVFPEIQKLCEANVCRFQAVDLRWGVSEEAALDQQTMNICLTELKRCQDVSPRPNFIILLGDRYGWIPLPPQVDASEFADILSQSSPDDRTYLDDWYKLDTNAVPPEYVLRSRKENDLVEADYDSWGKTEERLRRIFLDGINRIGWPENDKRRIKYECSATHQEIIEGALKLPDEREHVFAFLRNIRNVKNLPLGNDYSDPGLEKARALKETIKQTKGVTTYSYDVAWSGKELDSHIKQFTDDALVSLRRIVEEEFRQLKQIDDLTRENLSHEEFGAERSRHFVGRQKILTDIAAYIHSNQQSPLVVYGPSGSGKSALMAKAVLDAEGINRQAHIIRRFIGATPESTDIRTLLENLVREVTAAYNVDATAISPEYKNLKEELQKRLQLATAQKPLIIFLDAIDQLSVSDNAHSLNWLPSTLPLNVKIVISVMEREDDAGECLRSARSKVSDASVHRLEDMTPEEGEQALRKWLLEAYPEKKRTLTDNQMKSVLSGFTGCPKPLYLKLVFEEARRWKSYDHVTGLANDVPGVVGNMLARLQDKKHHGEVLVKTFLGLLSAARHGLSETEILALLSGDGAVMADLKARSARSPEAKGIPTVVWLRLYHDLAPHLMDRLSGYTVLLDFYHSQFGATAEQRYLATSGSRACAHRKLARLFLKHADPSGDRHWSGMEGRSFEELTHHLRAAGHMQTAARLMRHLRYLDARCALTDPFVILDEFTMLSEGGDTEAGVWRDFLRPRTGLLRLLPDTLPSLAWREGPPSVCAAVEEYMHSGLPRRPWLKLDLLPEIDITPSAISGQSYETVATCDLRTNMAAISSRRGVGFFLECLGRVAVVDLLKGTVGAATIEVPRFRPLAMATTEDGKWLAFVDERGNGTLHEIAWSDSYSMDPTCVSQESFYCLLPEIERPAIGFAHGGFWWQDRDGRFQQRHLAVDSKPSTSVVEMLPGELRGVSSLNSSIVAWSVKSQVTHVLFLDITGSVMHRRTLPCEVSSGCILKEQPLLLFLCHDGSSLVLGGEEFERTENGPDVPCQMAEAVPISGGVLLTSFEMRRYFWPGSSGAPVQLLSDFPNGYGSIQAIAENGDDVLVIMYGAAFRLRRSGVRKTRADIHVWAMVPTETGYYAIEDRPDGAYCISTVPPATQRFRDHHVGPIQAVASMMELAWLSRSAPPAIWKPPNGTPTTLEKTPGTLRALAVGEDGRFWFVNEFGEIFSLSFGSGFAGHAILTVRQPQRHRLILGREWLFWTGLSLGESSSGVDNLETLVVYQLHGNGGSPHLNLIGQRFFDPADGLWTLSIWDETHKELACFFQQLGEHRHFVRVGAPEDFLKARDRVVQLKVAETELCAALPLASGRAWLIRSGKGTVMALAKQNFEQLAAFRGLTACTTLACRPGPENDALVVEDYCRVLRCALQT